MNKIARTEHGRKITEGGESINYSKDYYTVSLSGCDQFITLKFKGCQDINICFQIAVAEIMETAKISRLFKYI